ncbi:hypothetical protein [Flavobacterium sp.]
MASTSEVGHTKNVTNFETAITFCTGYGTNYVPSNINLLIANLTLLHIASKGALALVKATQAPFDNVEGERQLIFKVLKKLATRIMGALISSGVAETVIKDAETINRKIQGKRANNKPEVTEPGDQPKDTVSVSQQSYDLLIDHFEKLIQLVSSQPKYTPNETDLKVVTINAYKTQLETINTGVKTAYIPYNNAMIARDKRLYQPEIGLVPTAQLVKNYVKSIYGATSPEYKAINGLRFKTYKR